MVIYAKGRHESLLPELVIILITRFWILNMDFEWFEFPQKVIAYVNREWTYDKYIIVKDKDVWKFILKEAMVLHGL
jgi:hypothetical protein